MTRRSTNQRGEPDIAAGERALRVFDLAIHRRLDGLLLAEHAGRRPGLGGELADVRIYSPGQDDARRIDWHVTARSAEAHVRTSVAEPELETWVLVDGSASMDFGTAGMEKRDLAVAVVSAVHALTDRPGNRLGAHLLGGVEPRTFPPHPGRRAARVLLRALLAAPRTPPGHGGLDLAAGLERLLREHRRTGLRVVVSDFLPRTPDENLSWVPPLRRLAVRHEVIAVQVTDPREAALPDVGLLRLVDPESGRTAEVATNDRRLQERYARAVADHWAVTAMALRAAGADHVALRTDGDWVGDIARFLAGRRRTARRRVRAFR
ncbi:DUF58 domain-containing protein [Pseudonocardia sichuanensis]